MYHFAVLLPERAALGRFAAHLSRLNIRAGTADHLVSESFYLTDPDGLGIEVYADRARELWTTRGREIAMAVDPLDVAGLIAAAGPVAWERAPAATTIGHMHLHVGDLDRAEAFYHSALGFDKTLWSFPGALFLAAGGYHHHLGTNIWSPGPAATDDQARLLEWELVVPDADAAAAVAASLGRAGYAADVTGAGWAASDPWGTRSGSSPPDLFHDAIDCNARRNVAALSSSPRASSSARVGISTLVTPSRPRRDGNDSVTPKRS